MSDVRLKPLLSSTYQQIWNRKSPIATLQMHLSFTAYRLLVRAKSLDWSEQTVSGRAQP
ncbi:hypothetical protein SCLCIDRAFT_168731 [Scleroderma citrinum Foug A]|uniref:Uncharacterized protein n=1 Tax=Scleroderma citrinum Foug A TaxID=1036808 RepID=A0A0C3ESF8_9AGAM|nr:hypothetical protein SCLCIDRAFT_168731 [Scleroderma citrinum Foug A]